MALVIDTSALYAALDRTDQRHEACRRTLEDSTEQLVVPAPVLPELDYLVRSRMHSAVATRFLGQLAAGAYRIEDLTPDDYRRVHQICERYEDVGFVDAAILAIVERLNEPKLATLDRRHFGMLRPRHVETLTLLPE